MLFHQNHHQHPITNNKLRCGGNLTTFISNPVYPRFGSNEPHTTPVVDDNKDRFKRPRYTTLLVQDHVTAGFTHIR